MRNHQTRKDVIVIADDDPTMRRVMQAALAKDGFAVIATENGMEACRAFAEHAPVLVLLDVEMPVQDGFEACAEIRSLPGGAAVPVVMVTGRDDVMAVNKCYDVGATDFIAKPINLPIFSHRLRYILRASTDYKKLRQTEAKNEALLRAIPDTLIVISPGDRIAEYIPGTVDRSMADPTARNLALADFLPKRVAFAWKSAKELVLATGTPKRVDFTLKHKVGEPCHYEARFGRYLDDHVLVLVSEITERKQAEQRIHRLAYYDSLTGLPNRQFFRQRLQAMIEKAAGNDEQVAVLYIDLDNFKRINDTLGHTFGDGVLKAIAERLSGCVRSHVSDSRDSDEPLGIARLGGDEFVAAIEGIDSEELLTRIADRLREKLRQPVNHLGVEFVVTPSIGISVYPHDGDNVEDLLMHADVAMYQAKDAGRNNVRFYSGTMSIRSLKRLEVESELRQALENDDLLLHYQPKFDLRTGALSGVEALLRWQHRNGEFIPPGDFVPVAEESGLIIPLGEWVLRHACEQAHRWQTRFRRNVVMAVNISGQQFYQSDLRKVVMKALFEASLKPSLLQLELTESLLMRDVKDTIATLDYLKSTGVTLAIDDFGTGYSSLSYLKRFPLDALKIDRSFVKDLPADDDDANICAAIIAVAHHLGLHVIAEGVETEEQITYLRQLGCDQVQGFLLGRPATADEFESRFLAQPLDLPDADSVS